jgi:multidrug efflux pump subunit AcrA (membrane-fusion protein)
LNPSESVATFMELDPLRLELGIPGYQINQVSKGALVLVTLPALPDQLFRGTVSRVAIAAPLGKHLFEVEVSVPNRDGIFHPGMSARARIVIETLESAIAIPADLPVKRAGKRVVFFADEGRATSFSVEDGILHGDTLVLRGDLPQRQLIVRGHRDLPEGLPVTIDNRMLASQGSKP